jgi:hypothetical protein
MTEVEAIPSMDNSAPEGTLQTSGLAAPVQMPADEEAAMRFTQLLPYVRRFGDALPSKGGLVRVLHALAEFPLGATKPRLLNDAERQLFQIMMELQGYKSTVVTSIMKKNAEVQKQAEALKQTAEAIAPTAESEVQNG